MKHFVLLLLLWLNITQFAHAEFSAILMQELAIDNDSHIQKNETLFKPEWNLEIDENFEMTIIARARWDSSNNLGPRSRTPVNYGSVNKPLLLGSEGEISIREWYLDTEFWGSFWRFGKQQVVWGQADGLKVLDVINPQSFREFILDDFDNSRIPLWMMNVEIPIGEDDSFQILWIPDSTYNEFAEENTVYEITSPLFVPQLPEGIVFTKFLQNKPSSVFKDSDFGIRYSNFYQGWDLTFNYLYHFHDFPVNYQEITPAGIEINSEYERNHLFGATASNAFGSFTLRTEVGYSSNTFHLSNNFFKNGIHQSGEWSFVIGLDWRGLEDTMLSFQWFQSYLMDYNDSVIRPQSNNIFSFLYKRTFQNEILDVEVLSLYGADEDDGSIQIKINYMLESNIKIWVGVDIFYGGQDGLFGQFKTEDRLVFGIELGI